jgi:hypothetical protein
MTTDGSLGSIPSLIILSNFVISSLVTSIPNKAFGISSFAEMPSIKSPPLAFANEDTSARNSFYACLYSIVFPSDTELSINNCKSVSFIWVISFVIISPSFRLIILYYKEAEERKNFFINFYAFLTSIGGKDKKISLYTK